MLLTKEVEVKLNSSNMKHYKELGYYGNKGDVIIVPVEHLTHGSKVKIQVLCDYCQNEIIEISYGSYIKRLHNVPKSACKKCSYLKSKECCLELYGVTNMAALEDVKNKIKEKNLEKYGAENYMATKEGRDKASKTIYEKYGVENCFQSEECKNKGKKTMLFKYGVEYPSQSQEIRDKIKQSVYEKYGVEHISQSIIIRERVAKTLYENGTIIASRQQIYLHQLFGGELNYPVSHYSADICFPDEKLVIEYDGGGHNLRVTLGELTQEEYNTKELIRDKMIKSKGYKQMRIISSKDLLPSDEVLLQLLSHARQYFSEFPSHSWISYNFDTSEFRNAENKEGVYYDFGELRRISKSDVETSAEASIETPTEDSTASVAAD